MIKADRKAAQWEGGASRAERKQQHERRPGFFSVLSCGFDRGMIQTFVFTQSMACLWGNGGGARCLTVWPASPGVLPWSGQSSGSPRPSASWSRRNGPARTSRRAWLLSACRCHSLGRGQSLRRTAVLASQLAALWSKS